MAIISSLQVALIIVVRPQMVLDLRDCNSCQHIQLCDVSQITRCQEDFLQIDGTYYGVGDEFEDEIIDSKDGKLMCPSSYYNVKNECLLSDDDAQTNDKMSATTYDGGDQEIMKI